MRKAGLFGSLLVLALLVPRPLAAHCEIPCGIYDDQARAQRIAEHIMTIEKSMRQIAELRAAGEKNYNQLVRWIVNKEDHATKLQHIVTQYFMTQRLKPADPADEAAHGKYMAQLEVLHGMLVAAMRAKQTTDLAHVARLRELLERFRTLYFGEKAEAGAHAHGHSH
ncbi:MAG: superoxide dismutase [Ni] [Candidatus Brocadiia bacterium]